MSSGYVFEGKGIGGLIDALETKGEAVNKVQTKALKLASQPILNSDYAKAPYLTQAGRSSMKVGRVSRKGGRASIVIGIENTAIKPVFYMKFQEFGTHTQDGAVAIEAKHFTHNALQENKEQAVSIIIKELKGALAKK